MRRRGRKLVGYTEAERKELQRLDKNKLQRKRYDERRSQEFFVEYIRLCRRYKFFVGGVYGCGTGIAIRKNNDKNRLKMHLEGLEYRDY